jgi:hypothetical protein
MSAQTISPSSVAAALHKVNAKQPKATAEQAQPVPTKPAPTEQAQQPTEQAQQPTEQAQDGYGSNVDEPTQREVFEQHLSGQKRARPEASGSEASESGSESESESEQDEATTEQQNAELQAQIASLRKKLAKRKRRQKKKRRKDPLTEEQKEARKAARKKAKKERHAKKLEHTALRIKDKENNVEILKNGDTPVQPSPSSTYSLNKFLLEKACQTPVSEGEHVVLCQPFVRLLEKLDLNGNISLLQVLTAGYEKLDLDEYNILTGWLLSKTTKKNKMEAEGILKLVINSMVKQAIVLEQHIAKDLQHAAAKELQEGNSELISQFFVDYPSAQYNKETELERVKFLKFSSVLTVADHELLSSIVQQNLEALVRSHANASAGKGQPKVSEESEDSEEEGKNEEGKNEEVIDLE